MPRNTIDKIKYLVNMSTLNFTEDDISEITESYGYFLNLYHQSGNQFYYNKNKSLEISDVAKFKDATKSIFNASRNIKQ